MRAPLDAVPLASIEAAAVFEVAEFEFVVDVASIIDILTLEVNQVDFYS